MHDACLQTKLSENLYSVMRDSSMNAYGVKSKRHLVYLTSEKYFLVENFGISLLSSFGDYLSKCPELFFVAITRAYLVFVILTKMPRKLMVFAASSDLLVFSVK